MHRVPDALSRIQEIAAFEEVVDPLYLRRREEIRDNPVKY